MGLTLKQDSDLQPLPVFALQPPGRQSLVTRMLSSGPEPLQLGPCSMRGPPPQYLRDMSAWRLGNRLPWTPDPGSACPYHRLAVGDIQEECGCLAG